MDSTKVKVMVRCRPLLPRENIGNSRPKSVLKLSRDHHQIAVGEGRDSRIYTFDHVFDENSDQQDVYDRCVHDLVEGCFNGYNATVLAFRF